MSRALLCVAVLVSGCGRIDFTPSALGDATSSDTAVDDGNTDALPATCPTGVLICDLLDAATVDTTLWNIGNGTIVVDSAVAHRGTSSLRFSMPAAQPGIELGIYFGHTGPTISTATELYTRVWFRMTALPLSTNALELIAIQQSGAQGNYVFVRAANTELYHQFDDLVGPAGAPPPVDTWFCLVWHIQLATSSVGSSLVTSDGSIPPFSITNSVTQGTPPVDFVAFGPYFAPNNIDVMQPAFDVWVDDIIVDDAPVSCAD